LSSGLRQEHCQLRHQAVFSVNLYRNPSHSGFSTTTNTAGSPINIGDTVTGLAITPNGATVYVTDFNEGNGDTVTPISTTTHKAGKAIKVGLAPNAIAIAPATAAAPPTDCTRTTG
jgi:DNA-binding beta-propeller fold protein YncE